ncbi:MAG: hypothetical protein M3Y73_13875 [Actinomycetota bacterium]|nr:hypothetical protein [Actinomycetota bacterium]
MSSPRPDQEPHALGRLQRKATAPTRHDIDAQLGDRVVPTRPYAPGVREERDDLIVALRDAVLHRRDAGALWTFAQTGTGADDLDVLETFSRLLPPTDTRRSVVLARLRRVVS